MPKMHSCINKQTVAFHLRGFCDWEDIDQNIDEYCITNDHRQLVVLFWLCLDNALIIRKLQSIHILVHSLPIHWTLWWVMKCMAIHSLCVCYKTHTYDSMYEQGHADGIKACTNHKSEIKLVYLLAWAVFYLWIVVSWLLEVYMVLCTQKKID